MSGYARLGQVSGGTLRSEDLARRFHEELSALAAGDTFDPERKARVQQALGQVDLDGDEAGLQAWLQEEAYELFSEYCPPFAYFGANQGDGSAFGFWPDIDALEESARFRDSVVKVNAGDPWPELAVNVYYVFEVNDHGNVTLFDANTRQEIWSCV